MNTITQRLTAILVVSLCATFTAQPNAQVATPQPNAQATTTSVKTALEQLGIFMLKNFPYDEYGQPYFAEDWCHIVEGESGYNWWYFKEHTDRKEQYNYEAYRVRHGARIVARYVDGEDRELHSSILFGLVFVDDLSESEYRAQVPLPQVPLQRSPKSAVGRSVLGKNSGTPVSADCGPVANFLTGYTYPYTLEIPKSGLDINNPPNDVSLSDLDTFDGAGKEFLYWKFGERTHFVTFAAKIRIQLKRNNESRTGTVSLCHEKDDDKKPTCYFIIGYGGYNSP